MASPENSSAKTNGENPGSAGTSYKAQLDAVAERARNPEGGQNGNGDGVVEKVSRYVPAIGKMLGKADEPEEPPAPSEVPGPPERPLHDPQIQEFMRDQHRSKVLN